MISSQINEGPHTFRQMLMSPSLISSTLKYRKIGSWPCYEQGMCINLVNVTVDEGECEGGCNARIEQVAKVKTVLLDCLREKSPRKWPSLQAEEGVQKLEAPPIKLGFSNWVFGRWKVRVKDSSKASWEYNIYVQMGNMHVCFLSD